MRKSSLVLGGFHPDPSVIRVGDTFYVANSTFEWFPGVVIHESKNLVNWEFTGYVLEDEKSLPMEGVINSGGVWAPCLSYDGKKFYVIFSITRTFDEFTQDTRNYLTCSENIHGPWSEPVFLNCGGFDASLFHDDDGKKYLVNMIWNETAGENHFHGIEIQEYDEKLQKLVGERVNIFKGTDRGLTEGPHIYKMKGYYYLLTAEGGTSTEHCVTMARSRSLYGPYEVYEKPILTSCGYPDNPIQYAGHGDLVFDRLGNCYLFHLGSRKKLFSGFSVFGRETFMQNIVFDDNDWPVLVSGNEPFETVEIPDEIAGGAVLPGSTFFKEYDFSIPQLHSDFMSLRKPLSERMSFTERPGYLRLHGSESLSSRFEQTLLCVRISECRFRASTLVDFRPTDIRERAGLIITYHSANYYYLYIGFDDEAGKRFIQLVKRDTKKTQLMLKKPIYLEDALAADCKEVELSAEFTEEGLVFFYRFGDDKEQTLDVLREECPVSILSDEYANLAYEQGFTGAFVGIGVQDLTGRYKEADFSYFKLSPLNGFM